MSKALENRTIAITEHRFEKELMSLIERHWATVISCPLLEERPVPNRAQLRVFIEGIIEEDFDFVVFFLPESARGSLERKPRLWADRMHSKKL